MDLSLTHFFFVAVMCSCLRHILLYLVYFNIKKKECNTKISNNIIEQALNTSS